MLKRNLYSLIASVLLLSGCNFLPMNNNVGSNNNSINNDNILYQYEDIVEGQVVEGAYSQFVNINILSSYLGYGYDVVNDPYMDKDYINMSAPILDMDKIKDAKLKMIKENNQDVDNYSGSDFVEFSEDYSNGFNIDVGSNLKKIKFSGSVNTSFNCKGKEQTYMKFQKSVYKVNSFNLYLTDSLKTIKNMISDEFLEDVDQLTAKSLFNKYGTHLIKEVAMGGRVETDSIWYSNTVGYSEDVELEVEAHANILKNIAKLDVELNSDSEISLNQKGIRYEERLDSIGGPALNISTSATVAEGMNAWLEKLDNDLSVSALSGIVGENSLIPLWDLIPDTDYEKREELQRVFNEQCAENYDAICDIYKLNKNRDVRIICDETQGTVLGNESPYIDGDTVTLTAKPNSGYMFDGWYIEDEMVSNKTTYSFDIHINTTLEARFNLSSNVDNVKEEIYYDEATGELIVDISKYQSKGTASELKHSNFENNTLTIYPKINYKDISKVKIIGAYNSSDDKGRPINTLINDLSFKFDSSWNKNIELELVNVGIKGNINYSAFDFSSINNNYNVNIICKNSVYIEGYSSSSHENNPKEGILGVNISIKNIDDATSTIIKGGNGYNAPTDVVGGAGASAVSAKKLSLSGNISCVGGNGGNGGNSSAVANGSRGADGTEKGQVGGNGTNGQNGKNGMDGGAGASAVRSESITFEGKITLTGGNGGIGGNGSAGGNGGAGGTGHRDWNWFEKWGKDGGMGGHGGAGGNGGTGGQAGKGFESSSFSIYQNSVVILNLGIPGTGGNGGAGGNGGNGGNGGSGEDCATGNGGAGGNGGTGGSGGNYYVQYKSYSGQCNLNSELLSITYASRSGTPGNGNKGGAGGVPGTKQLSDRFGSSGAYGASGLKIDYYN